eukprot:gene20899-16966_t
MFVPPTLRGEFAVRGTGSVFQVNVDCVVDVRWWEWRSITGPITPDDLPRTAVDRPDHWAPNVTATALQMQKAELEGWSTELHQLRTTSQTSSAPRPSSSSSSSSTQPEPFAAWSRDDQADYWALSSAISRVFWELNIFRSDKRDPGYYVQNSLGAVWDELVRGPAQGKWTDARVLNRLIPRVRAIPEALAAGIAALPAEAVAIFASNALASYFPGTGPTSTGPLPLSKQVTAAFAAIVKQPGVSAKTGADLVAAGKEAADWVDRYGIWLAKAVADGGLASNSSVGEANLLWFLEHVSLVNTTLWPLERIVSLGESEFNHATTMIEVRDRADAAGSPEEPIFGSLDAQIAATLEANVEIRSFVNKTKIVTIPNWLEDYSVAGIPNYLAPFGYGCLGEVDDF